MKLDPRVHASQDDLVDQRDLALQISRGMKSSYDSYKLVAALDKALAEHQQALSGADKTVKEAAEQLAKKIAALKTGPQAAPGFGSVNRDLGRLLFSVENADMRPTQTVRAAVQQSCDALDKDLLQWKQVNEQHVAQFNELLVKNRVPGLQAVAGSTAGCKP